MRSRLDTGSCRGDVAYQFVLSLLQKVAQAIITALTMACSVAKFISSDVPRQKPSKLVTKAIRLLGEGKTQSQAAKQCGVSTRTLQRWVASEGAGEASSKKQSNQLVLTADRAVQAALADASVQQQITDLIEYRNSQKFLAISMGSLANRLSKVSLQAIERLENNPDELSSRSLPQFLRAVADLSEKASNCWARSVGLDDLLERVSDDSPADS